MTFPTNFHEWRHCIEVKCGIPLTASFILQRIEALSDLNNITTKEFTRLYGEDYRVQVIQWYQQAQLQKA